MVPSNCAEQLLAAMEGGAVGVQHGVSSAASRVRWNLVLIVRWWGLTFVRRRGGLTTNSDPTDDLAPGIDDTFHLDPRGRAFFQGIPSHRNYLHHLRCNLLGESLV
jgi:hypothetical protein